MKQYYCDVSTRKVYEVLLAPSEKQVNLYHPDRLAIYDVDRDPRCYYIVAENRVKPTKAEAIWAAKEELDEKDDEISREMQKLQAQRDEIGHLLECGDPENDGT